MIFVDNEKTTDPRLNLSIEEYLLRDLPLDDDILLFYINEPSIIVGRHQNTIEEINRAYVDEHHIHVVRRLSGGGAVYHDLGNLNYSLIMHGKHDDVINFKKFTAPVVKALQKMGIPAELSGRNDLLIDNRKVSGNAIYSTAQGLVCHGTLLFKADLTRLSEALNVKPAKIQSKGIKSVRSRVANISEFLSEPIDVETFKNRLLNSIFDDSDTIPRYQLTTQDWENIKKLANERYMTWEWNYGYSPSFNLQKLERFSCGEVDARLEVQDGRITNIHFFGDFFGREDTSGLEALLNNTRYERESLKRILEAVEIHRYFDGVTNQEFIDFLY